MNSYDIILIGDDSMLGAIKWAKGTGRSDSIGNGALMRISPVGYLFNTEEDVYKKLNLSIKYELFSKFNITCYDTIGNCLYAIYNSNSFEDAIRKILLMGGDTDTNACIVGSVAEALYGMNKTQKELAKKDLPSNFVKVLKKVYE